MNCVVFYTEEYEHIGKILAEKPCELGQIDRQLFPDGEVGLRIETKVADRDVIVVGGTWSASATLELYDIGCAIAKYGARSLTFVVPYFGCSTMERATHPGDVVTAKTRARLFSAIPQAHIGNRILLLDLHAEGIPHYFEGSITATHVYAKPVISKAVKQIIAQLGGDVVLASTDSGRAKWVESLANDLDLPAAFIMKRRIDGNTTKVLNVTADVKDKTVIIYDDMIRTAGSLIGAAQTYKKAGAKQIAAVATHGVFAGKGWQKMVDSGLFARVAVTDSHPSAVGLAHLPKEVIKVWSTAELFMPYLAESNEDD